MWNKSWWPGIIYMTHTCVHLSFPAHTHVYAHAVHTLYNNTHTTCTLNHVFPSTSMHIRMHTTCTVHAPEGLQQYRGIWTGHARTRLALQCVALFSGTDFPTAVELIIGVIHTFFQMVDMELIGPSSAISKPGILDK